MGLTKTWEFKMTTMTRTRFERAVREGFVEVEFDETRSGFVTFKNTKTGTRFTVQVVD